MLSRRKPSVEEQMGVLGGGARGGGERREQHDQRLWFRVSLFQLHGQKSDATQGQSFNM